jgi:hypothetical protein
MAHRWAPSSLAERWWLDVPVASLSVVVLDFASRPGTGVDLLGKLSLSDRRAAYTDMLQLAIIFAGFSGVIFAIYLGMQGKGVEGVRKLVGDKLLRLWLAALLMPWLSAVVIILARIIDRGEVSSTNFARWLATAAVIVVLTQLFRVTWIFYQLAMLNAQQLQPSRRIAARPIRIGRPASVKSQT